MVRQGKRQFLLLVTGNNQLRHENRKAIFNALRIWLRLILSASRVLPPIYAKGCFGMGECDHGNSYFWFAQNGDKYFAVLGEREAAERVFAKLTYCEMCKPYKRELPPGFIRNAHQTIPCFNCNATGRQMEVAQ